MERTDSSAASAGGAPARAGGRSTDALERSPLAAATDRGTISLAFLTGAVLLAAVAGAAAGRAADHWSVRAVLPVSMASLVAAAVASSRLRARRSEAWTFSQRDPFLALAAAVVVFAGPAALDLAGVRLPRALAAHQLGASAVVAGALGAVGLLVMVRDLSPGRALDSLYLAAIGAISLALGGWVLLLPLLDARPVSLARSLELLGPVTVDLVVLVLGIEVLALRARGHTAVRLIVAAWLSLFVVHTDALLSQVRGLVPAPGPARAGLLLALGLLGAASLHPDAVTPTQPTFGPLDRLPRTQIALLGGAVLLGPAILALQLDEQGTTPLVLLGSVVLSLLVVTHLVRLVQGRAALEHRAHHDELTGLANRSLFADRASVAIAHARRTGGHCAVLFLDLDRFKTVNDSLGHSVGNQLLQAVAKRLRSVTRPEDTVARLGGDEFVVFVPQIDSPEDAAAVATKILDRFGDEFSLSGHRLFASPSIGIAVFPADGDNADVLLKHADTAMYRAKQRGRRTFCAYDRSMNDHAHERLNLENRLHTAIDDGEMRLHYQPKLHLPTGKVMGMEALLRWDHPELGLLEPSAFISVAEDSGLIVPLGEWAIEEACRQNKAWVDAGFEPLVVAVNLSLRQFQQQHIEDVIARILRQTGLPPELLELEVTESLAMQDPDRVRSTLLDLREMGVQCSIDDFGTGYSGLSHLTRFPIDKLKIDKAFVATIDTDWEAPIVVAVVALAHGLGLQVVAEGVETNEQLERLQELGCDEMQGYLFSRPLPPERFEQLLMLETVAPGPGRLVVPMERGPRLVRAVG